MESKIIHGDCMEELKKLPDSSVDCIVTDPPFFMPANHYQSRINWQKKYSDLTPLRVFWEEVTKELSRVLKKDGHIFVFSNCDSYPVFYEAMYGYFDKLKSIVWDKTRVGLGRIFRNQHELIIWGRWKEHRVINDGKLRADVLSYPATLTKNREHPVEKPTALLKDLILATTNPNDVVLDCFAGGGSTMVACIESGRKYIMMEKELSYIQTIRERAKTQTLPNGNLNGEFNKDLTDFQKENPKCPSDTSLNPDIKRNLREAL
jgi:site-specific DNA-methyltransferase (adenine-specific)